MTLSKHLWAKSDPYHPLWCHLLDVAGVCNALLPRFGGVAGIPNEWLLYLVALHDIGKADAQFQNKADPLTETLRQSGIWFPQEPLQGFRHEARSAKWLQKHLPGQFNWGKSSTSVICQAITGHHGDFQADAYTEEENARLHWEAWGQLRDDLAEMVRGVLHLEPFAVDRFADASASGMKLSGLIVLSDWIASNPETYHYSDPSKVDSQKTPEEYWAAAQTEGQAAVHRLQLDLLNSIDGSESADALPAFSEVWPGMTPRPTQVALETALKDRPAPGLLIIEAPMGEGKTEAALYAAECWPGIGAYIALPTQATSNQMHGRYARFLARRRPAGAAPRLVHGMAWLLDDVMTEDFSHTEDGDEGLLSEERLLSREWFANAKRALLATDGVGTVDQVLMAALNVKHGFLRFLGLTAKTLIIDEVHAYDVYMSTLLKTLLQWCHALHVPVILLSATLSQAQKRSLASAYRGEDSLLELAIDPVKEPYPLLTFVPSEGPSFAKEVPADPKWSRIIQVQRHPETLGDPVEIARLAAQAVAEDGCACILANTVRSAQEIFQALQDASPDGTKLFLFHARFRAKRRQEIEEEILRLFGKEAGNNRPKRAILVATQVVEQSLDIDFDVMLSEIAPIDLLLQRCGRLHRHPPITRAANQPAILHLILPSLNAEKIDFGGMEIKPSKDHTHWRGVYDRAALLRTLALLEARSEINLPADFRPMIEGCYASSLIPISSFPAEWIDDAEKLRAERQAQSERKAKVHLVAEPSTRLFKYAQKPDQPLTEGEEGEQASFFRAQTREGDDSRSVLILHDPILIDAVREGSLKERMEGEDWRPGKILLKKLFLQKASLPAYWLAGVSPAEGYEWLDKHTVPKRLRHHLVLIMQDKEWKGIQTKHDEQTDRVINKSVTITDDDVLGLRWLQEKEEENADL